MLFFEAHIYGETLIIAQYAKMLLFYYLIKIFNFPFGCYFIVFNACLCHLAKNAIKIGLNNENEYKESNDINN